ncbi:peroxidase-like protein [Klebsiella pneumoniae RYC492]|nr:peroxidase-like protein [Klebsiella pneumoniae RYC492]CDK92271.1 Macrophage infectivity potentiator-related protein [Klebsiella pneumoniae IS33]
MSRLADIREQDATGKAADIFAGIKKAMGKVPNAYLTIGGHSPAALQQALAHNAMLHKAASAPSSWKRLICRSAKPPAVTTAWPRTP